jgi:hypothetical protein
MPMKKDLQLTPAALSAWKRFRNLANLPNPQLARDQFSPSPTSPTGMPPGRDFGARVQNSTHGSNIDQSLPMPMGQDPAVSERQERAMQAAAHGESTLGIPQHVGKEFVESDQETWNSLVEKRRCEQEGRDQEFRGAGPGNPPPVGPDQHSQFLEDLHDGGFHSSDYGVGNPNAIPGRPRDGLDDNQVDLLRPREGTKDCYDELQQGMPTERDAGVLAAIRQYLKSCNYSDADRAEVIHYFLNDRNNAAEPEAQDDQIGGPPRFKGMPERGGTMADQNVMTGNSGSVIGYAGDSGGDFSPPDDFDKLYPKAFAMDSSCGAYDQQYEYERLKALTDVKREREAKLQLAQDTAIAYGHFLNRLADRRPRALDFDQTKRLATPWRSNKRAATASMRTRWRSMPCLCPRRTMATLYVAARSWQRQKRSLRSSWAYVQANISRSRDGLLLAAGRAILPGTRSEAVPVPPPTGCP